MAKTPLIQTPEVPVDTMAEALAAASARLSPVMAGDRAMPLPHVQPVGTKTTTSPDKSVTPSPAFDKPGTIDMLMSHPSADVRARAAEAQVAIHHGASDIGLKVRAALDLARSKQSQG